MRTQEEIFNRIKEREDSDPFGFEVGEYIDFLDFEHACSFLKPEVAEGQWNGIRKEPTTENILATMLKYMPFAWKKANNCRGISAERSIMHYEAWLWLLNDGFLEQLNEIEYEHYGKEKLIAICEKYGWDWKQWDDGVRTND